MLLSCAAVPRFMVVELSALYRTAAAMPHKRPAPTRLEMHMLQNHIAAMPHAVGLQKHVHGRQCGGSAARQYRKDHVTYHHCKIGALPQRAEGSKEK